MIHEAHETHLIGPMSVQSLSEQGWKQRELPGFAGLIGPLWTRRLPQEGWAYGILADDRHTNPAGRVHGGLLMSLIDHAMSTVAWEHVGRIACVTVQMDTRFLGAAKAGEFVVANASVEKATSSLVFTRGVLRVHGQDIVSASAVMKPHKPAVGRTAP